MSAGFTPGPADYEALKAYGHSPAKAAEVVLDAQRGDRYSQQWIDLARKARGDSSIATLTEFGADPAGRASPRAEKSSRPFGDHHGENK